MPSSGSRLEEDLSTDLESPEMTQKASASTNCNGIHGGTRGHHWPMDVERTGELSLPGEFGALCPPAATDPGRAAWSCRLCQAVVLRWGCFGWPRSTLCVLSFGGIAGFLCVFWILQEFTCLGGVGWGWGGSTYTRDRYWYLCGWDLDSKYLSRKIWIMLILAITNRSAF